VLALSILTAAASCGGVPDPSSSADNGSGGGSLPGGSTVPGPGPGGSSAGNPVGDIAFVGGQMVEGASCDSVGGEVVVGNGDIVDRPRPVTGFTKLRQESVLTTVVSQASGFAVSVRTDSNLQDIVTATVVDDVGLEREQELLYSHLAIGDHRVAAPRSCGAHRSRRSQRQRNDWRSFDRLGPGLRAMDQATRGCHLAMLPSTCPIGQFWLSRARQT
jgi:hypothetical protein